MKKKKKKWKYRCMENILQHEDKTNRNTHWHFRPSLKGKHRIRKKEKILNYFWHFLMSIYLVVMETVIFGSISRYGVLFFFLTWKEFHYEGDTKNVTDIWKEKRANKNFVVKTFSENYL